MPDNPRLLPRYRTTTIKRHLHQHLEALDTTQLAPKNEPEPRYAPLDTIDKHRRGIPLIAHGITGATPGSIPHQAILNADRRRRYG